MKPQLITAIFLVVLCGTIAIGAGLLHSVHKYSDIPGQDHPYCPPDPRECN